MSEQKQVMALNPARKGNMGRINSLQSLAVYDRLIAQPWLKGVVEQIRGEKPMAGVDAANLKAAAKAREELKKQLPFRAIHYARFRNNHRSQGDADPESFLFQTTVDVDDAEYVEQALEKARELNCSDTIWKGKLLHLEYSARKKLHIDIRMPVGMTIEETQRAYCEASGIPYDKSCITPERIIFITDKDSEIYRSKEWYAVLPAEEISLRREAFVKRGLTIDGRGKAMAGYSLLAGDCKSPERLADTAGSERLADSNLPVQMPQIHSFSHPDTGKSVKSVSSVGLKDNASAGSENFPQISQMPQIHSAGSEKVNSNYKVQSSNLNVQSFQNVQSFLNVQSFQNVQGNEERYPDPPAMPTQLPKLVEHLISNTPDVYKPAVAHAIFPPLATHLWNTRFRYIDNVEHEATLATVLLASTGAGKSCVQKPIEYIMEDIRKRDAENLKREKEWKDEVTRKGANKDKRKRPDNLIIQEIDADMTNPAFVMRTAEAQGHFLYTSLNEIDLFDALKGNGGQQFRIMCLAFDPSNKYGQTRVGSQSVTDRVTIRFNWNASSTIQKGQRYFSKVLTDGPISRINFCTIPEREIGEDMPVYGTYDETYREGLKPYIENLCQATGLVECEEAFQLALKLKEEHAEFSRLSQDRTYENLSFRANVIGYLKACVLYVANGYRWEPEIEEFIRWSEQYDLYCKMKFFGDAIKRAEGFDEKTSKRGPASLLQQLPDVFSFQQAEFLRSQLGMNRSGTVSMLRNWVNRNYVKKIPPQGAKDDVISIQLFSFEKLRNRKDGKVVNMLNS